MVKKVNIVYMAKDSARRATFKKRTQGLMKKVREMSTLCGVRACAIVYGPDKAQPEAVWPPTAHEMVSVLSRFKSMSKIEQNRKMMDRDEFLFHQVTKLQDYLCKQQLEYCEAEANLVIHRSLAGMKIGGFIGTFEEAEYLDFTIERKMRSVKQRIYANSLPTTVGSSSSNILLVARKEENARSYNVISMF